MDDENCHICGCYADGGTCAWDEEMNPDSEPQACCGCGDCAMDI